MEGFMTCLLQSIYLTGHDAFWSCEQRSWRLSSIRTSCLHASICQNTCTETGWGNCTSWPTLHWPVLRIHAGYPFTSQKQTTYTSHFNQTTLDGYCWSLSLDCPPVASLTRPVEAFSLQPTIQSHGHKMPKRHGGGRRTQNHRAGEDEHLSIPDTQGYYSDWSCALGTRFPEWMLAFPGFDMYSKIHARSIYHYNPLYYDIQYSWCKI